MLIVILILSSALIFAWLVLLGMANNEDWVSAAYNKVLGNITAIEKLHAKDAKKREKLGQYHGVVHAVMRLFLSGDSAKAIKNLERSSSSIQSGNLSSVSQFAMPGYVLQRKYDSIGKSAIHKAIMTNCLELYGKKHADNKAAQLLAGLLSYPIIGIGLLLGIGTLVMAVGDTNTGAAILGIGIIVVLVLVYAMYDQLNDMIRKRREAIRRQFPNVVSKLALLVTSGMIMDRAWQETAYSQSGELYLEMRKTSKELDNLVSPDDAYGGFLDRCNTKETAKLASAIMQNLSKGNAEIGRLLKDMAHEAWQERRHMAKRDAEKANSKLMIPTMLLLLAILVLIMVPVAMNFSSL